VWLSLGRAPVDSPPLDPGRAYRVRVEHDGYRPVELLAAAADFRPGEGGAVAELAAELVPTEIAARPPADADADPSADGATPAGFGDPARRRGRLRVTSSRDAAAVWLRLGTTPLVLDAVDASRRYELRIGAAGHTPYYRVIEPRDLAAGRVELAATLRRPAAAAPAPREPIARRGRAQ
jgi:hypothetical protein